MYGLSQLFQKSQIPCLTTEAELRDRPTRLVTTSSRCKRQVASVKCDSERYLRVTGFATCEAKAVSSHPLLSAGRAAGLQASMAGSHSADLKKVAVIFEAFDVDQDGKLDSTELTTLIQQCNPSVCFSKIQLEAITEEVMRPIQNNRMQSKTFC